MKSDAPQGETQNKTETITTTHARFEKRDDALYVLLKHVTRNVGKFCERFA
jgi:hypothetical protein